MVAGIDVERLAWTDPDSLFGELKAVFLPKAVYQRVELGRRAGAVYDQLLVLQPTDHVHVEHGDGRVERKLWIAHIASAADQPPFFPRERQKHDPPPQLLRASGQLPRHFHEHGRAPGV